MVENGFGEELINVMYSAALMKEYPMKVEVLWSGEAYH